MANQDSFEKAMKGMKIKEATKAVVDLAAEFGKREVIIENKREIGE